MKEEQYTPESIVLGVCVAVAIVLVAILFFNMGEIWAVIQTEGLLSE